MRVLIVEDYQPLLSALSQKLREEGYAVDTASDGEVGLWHARSGAYDVIVLDLMLPKVDGLTILKKLRAAKSNSCVLVLTAKDTLEDRVGGLMKGADDYLVKPFALEELLARIQALIRRKYDARSPTISVGDLEVDTASRTVRRGGKDLLLTAREYALLEFLAVRAGQVVSRTDIWEHLYEFHSSAESNVVDVYVGYLRKKIETSGRPKLIHTRRGQGYLLADLD